MADLYRRERGAIRQRSGASRFSARGGKTGFEGGQWIFANLQISVAGTDVTTTATSRQDLDAMGALFGVEYTITTVSL